MRISDWSSDVCSSDLRRQVQLLAVDVELSHIGYPFLARTHRVELTIQQVRCHAPDLTTIGSIFLREHQRPQAQRLHQALHRLVIDHITSMAQRHRTTSIAVAASSEEHTSELQSIMHISY